MATAYRATPMAQRYLAEERAVLEATEMITECLGRRDVKRQNLADRLGVSKSEISQRLSGKRNLTVKNLAAMLHELGYRLHFDVEDLAASPHRARSIKVARQPSWGPGNEGVHYTATGSVLTVMRDHKGAA